jgi:hypothetical protein
VRWHAPGAAALAGFVLRVGPAGQREQGSFYYLPDAATLPPLGNHLADEDSVGLDVDLDGSISPLTVVIRDLTRPLGELVDLGGLEAPDGTLAYTVPALLGGGDALDLYGVDCSGQLGPAASWSHFSADVAPGLDWPVRPLPPVGALVTQFVDDVTDHVDLCWDQAPLGRCSASGQICESEADCADSAVAETCEPTPDPAPFVAVFRTRVWGRCSGDGTGCDDDGDCEAAQTCTLRPDAYQQRSPLVDIRPYMAGGGGFPGVQCGCALGMTDGACWQDFGLTPSTNYRYTVLRFWGPPSAADRSDRGHRKEGEIQKAFGPATAEVPPP